MAWYNRENPGVQKVLKELIGQRQTHSNHSLRLILTLSYIYRLISETKS